MIPGTFDCFRQVWVVDFEFCAPEGGRPQPLCMVARELRTGRLIRLWCHELEARSVSPVPNRPEVLFVAYYASAELGCYQALGWPMPIRILDLFAEFRGKSNGLPTPCGNGLVGALAYHGIDSIDVTQKESMRKLAMRGGRYSPTERAALLDYCQGDVDALGKLLPKMAKDIDLPRALLRGRYMVAAARMEWTGVPMDTPVWNVLRDNWNGIQARLIEAVDTGYGFFEGSTFKATRFAEYLSCSEIPWPRLPSGALALDDQTFKLMAGAYPQLQPLRELRKTLARLRLNQLAIGPDGRNRCLLSAFRSKTGRNQPSNARFIFGLPKWVRGLIKPEPGRAVAYLDYGQQEFGIAASLSSDPAMMDAYCSGDPYLTFAKQAGAVPPDATAETHPPVRDQFKICALAVQYGMGAASLARSISQPEAAARELLRRHRQVYPRFWSWIEAARDRAMLTGELHTVFGWKIHAGVDTNPRTMLNFPMQANGAEILRLACCELTEAGIQVCAPIHDAVLIEAPVDDIDQTVAEAQRIMRHAAEVVLSGFPLRTDATIVRYPSRYLDKRGVEMWQTVMRILADVQTANLLHSETPDLLHGEAPTCSTVAHPVCLIK